MSVISDEFAKLPPVQSEIKQVSGTPEAYLKAPPGYIVRDTDGRLWQKFTPATSATGWIPLMPYQVYDLPGNLRDSLAHLDGMLAFVLGGTVPFDFGAGAGYWVYQSDYGAQGDDDGLTIIKPDDVEDAASTGRWRLADAAWPTSPGGPS